MKKRKRDTAFVAKALSGDKLYHQRARFALPVLVRQARKGETGVNAEL